MTAPAPATQAPVDDARPAREIMNDDALWQGMETPLRAEDAEAEAPGTPPRDEKGRFIKSHPDVDPGTEEEPEAEADAPEAVAEPEPEAEPPEPVAPPRPKATQFVVKDAEGEVELPELEIEFKADGQTRTMPLDKVVRLAQSGFYNEKLQGEVKESRSKVADYENRLSEVQERLERQVALTRALFESDDEFFIQRREEYRQQNSPEQRARRLEQELHRERSIRQQEWIAQQAQTFLQGDLEPKITSLLAQYPTVTDVEAAGWLAPSLKALEVNGIIPPQRYGEVRRLLEEDLSEYMAQVHAQRSETTKQAEAKRQVQLRKVQVEAAKAKRELTKVASPAKSPGAVTATAKPGKPAKAMSAKEANEAFWRGITGEPADEE